MNRSGKVRGVVTRRDAAFVALLVITSVLVGFISWGYAWSVWGLS